MCVIKKLSFAILLVLVLSSVAVAEINDSIDGFRGIKWGDPAEKCPELFFGITTKDNDAYSITVYTRKGEQLSLYGVKLYYIHYVFYNNEFAAVALGPLEREYQHLLDAFRVRFGEPEQQDYSKDFNFYEWKKGDVTISCVQEKHESSGMATIMCMPIIHKHVKRHYDAIEGAVKSD